MQYLLEVVADGVRAAYHLWDILTRAIAGGHRAAPGRPLRTNNQGLTRASQWRPGRSRTVVRVHVVAAKASSSSVPATCPTSGVRLATTTQSRKGDGRRCSFRPPLGTRRVRCTAIPSARSAGHECYSQAATKGTYVAGFAARSQTVRRGHLLSEERVLKTLVLCAGGGGAVQCARCVQSRIGEVGPAHSPGRQSHPSH